MPELLLELFSEEIPARMQARAAEDLSRLLSARIAPLLGGEPRAFHGPRRLSLAATLRPADVESIVLDGVRGCLGYQVVIETGPGGEDTVTVRMDLLP